jgi:peptidoglycan/xylan/chitin deacetylase (PgdA/CDA1 family)
MAGYGAKNPGMIQASVIIATYNRAERLHTCLQALAMQTASPNVFEVIVVIDGSTDGTSKMLASLRPPYSLRVLEQPNSGQSVAFNRAMKAARGSLCIFLDDDIKPDPKFVAEHLRLHSDRHAVIGLGHLTLSWPKRADWFARRFADSWKEHYEAINSGTLSPTWQDCYCGNMSAPRHVLEASGGFAVLPRCNDIEMGYRLKQQGYSFAYLAEALGDQDQQKGFDGLTRDSERSGEACVEICRRHPSALPLLLGGFSEQRPQMAAALRLLLALAISPHYLQWIGALLDRFSQSSTPYHVLQRYAYWRGVRRGLGNEEEWHKVLGGIPILMYHAFGVPGEAASRYVVPIHRFAQQMAWLKRKGYQVLSLNDLLRCRRGFRLPPARTIVVTIDDGYKDTRTLAYPVLRQNGFPATVFLVSDLVGQANCWDHASSLSKRALLSWEDAKEMVEGGMQFGAHSCSHADLTALSLDLARQQIETSRAVIEEKLGLAIRSFAYPYGKTNASVQELAEKAGLWGSCGIENGLNTLVSPLYALRRIEISGKDSLVDFALAVRFGASKQVVWKRMMESIIAKPLKTTARKANVLEARS